MPMRPSRLIRPIKRLQRRVVAAVAAAWFVAPVPAGAAVALKVEDHSAPLFAEPVVEQPLPRRRRSKAADESPGGQRAGDRRIGRFRKEG